MTEKIDWTPKEVELLFEITKMVTGIGKKEIKSKIRIPDVIDAKRMMAVCIIRNSRYTAMRVGAFLGGLDHSTICYYKRTHEDLMETDSDFKSDYLNILNKFRSYKANGVPINFKLKLALDEREKINLEIRKLRKLSKI